MRRRGFTLIEVLVVVAVIAILVGLLLPAVWHIKQQGKSHRARAQMRALRTALTQYHQAYDRWPGQNIHGESGPSLFDDPENPDPGAPGGAMSWSNDNDEVIGYLLPDHVHNWKKRMFWEQPGVVIDPWGDVLTIVLSNNQMYVDSYHVKEH